MPKNKHRKQVYFCDDALTSIKDQPVELAGQNPLLIGGKFLEEAGLRKRTPLQAIRAKCIDCCCGSLSEVRRCVAIDCTLWPHRMGKDGFRSKGGGCGQKKKG